jgi:hypothetical protein
MQLTASARGIPYLCTNSLLTEPSQHASFVCVYFIACRVSLRL